MLSVCLLVCVVVQVLALCAYIAGCMAQRTRHPLVGALSEEAKEKRRRDGAASSQRHRDKLALQGLTPLDRLSAPQHHPQAPQHQPQAQRHQPQAQQHQPQAQRQCPDPHHPQAGHHSEM